MSDFSKDIAERVRKKNEERSISDRKSLQDNERRTQLLGMLWMKVGDELDKLCAELNDEKCGVELKCLRTSHNVTISRVDGPACIESKYNPTTFTLNYSGILEAGHYWNETYMVKLTANGQDGYIVNEKGTGILPENIASAVITAIAGL